MADCRGTSRQPDASQPSFLRQSRVPIPPTPPTTPPPTPTKKTPQEAQPLHNVDSCPGQGLDTCRWHPRKRAVLRLMETGPAGGWNSAGIRLALEFRPPLGKATRDGDPRNPSCQVRRGRNSHPRTVWERERRGLR